MSHRQASAFRKSTLLALAFFLPAMVAAVSGMLMLDALPVAQRKQLQKILTWEADKHVEYGICKKYRSLPGRSPNGSVGESNAWTTALLQMARVAQPHSPRQAAWRETAIDYALNAICLPADVFNENRVNLSINGSPRSFGPHPNHDTWHDLHARSITIEKRLTLHAIAGEGSFQLLQKRRRSPDRSEMLYANDRAGAAESLLAHELYFGPPAYDRIRVVPPDTWFRNMILAIYCDPKRAPAKTNATVTGRHPCFAGHLPDAQCTVAVNFADTKQETDSPTGRIAVAPRSVTVRRTEP